VKLRRTLPLAFAGLTVLCAVLWVAAPAALYVAMRQAPETFDAIMSKVPGVG
jgi:hypothetical protein